MTGAAPSWAEVLELVTRLDSSGLADVEIDMPGLRLRVSRHALPAASPAEPAPAAEAAPPAELAGGRGTPVTAPVMGTVYLRPAPDSEPFVAVGDAVTDDTTVAIVEVMKLMNPVEAGVTGTVVEICVAEGAMVEEDQVLLRVEP